jgi:hypothetical protein
LIQNILDLKSWVLGYLKDGLENLVGHIEMHLFGFFVESSGWHVMEYKVSLTNHVWSLFLQLDYGKLIQMGNQSCLLEYPTLFHTT